MPKTQGTKRKLSSSDPNDSIIPPRPCTRALPKLFPSGREATTTLCSFGAAAGTALSASADGSRLADTERRRLALAVRVARADGIVSGSCCNDADLFCEFIWEGLSAVARCSIPTGAKSVGPTGAKSTGERRGGPCWIGLKVPEPLNDRLAGPCATTLAVCPGLTSTYWPLWKSDTSTWPRSTSTEVSSSATVTRNRVPFTKAASSGVSTSKCLTSRFSTSRRIEPAR